MFRRTSKKKTTAASGDQEDTDDNRRTDDSTLIEEEEPGVDGENRKSGTRRSVTEKTAFHNLNKKEILKEIFSVPVKPKMELHTELKNPKAIALEYLPIVFKLLEWTALFLSGYFGFSFAWIITLLLLYWARKGTQLSSSHPQLLSSAVAGGPQLEQQLLQQSRPGQLPSWVLFPDVERAEWMNVILRKVWPNLGEIARQIAKRLVEPKIKEILNRLKLEGVSNFKLKNFLLGNLPARVGGIKVYDRNTGRDEIVLDLEILYEGDASANFTIQNLECELGQITFRGTVRLTMKPLMDAMPVVGGLEAYFMKMPEYDYSLGKMAGLGEMPGISNIIRSVLDNIIRRGFVWPNRFNFYLPIEAVQNLRDQTFAMPSPQGVLQILVSEARHLMKKDHSLAGGKSDPYITISIGEKRISFVDRYVENSVNPVWNYAADFPIEEASGLDIKIEVFDFDNGSEDDFLGRTSIPVTSIMDADSFDRWITLDDAKHGDIKVRGIWRPTRPAALVEGGCNSYVAAVFVDSCSSIASVKSAAPFCKCEIKISSTATESLAASPLTRRDSKKWVPSERFDAFTTKPRGPSEDPVFKEGHIFLCRNPALDSITLQVVEQRTDLILGTVCIKISYIASLPDKQFSKMSWKLSNSISPLAAVTLSAKLYAF